MLGVAMARAVERGPMTYRLDMPGLANCYLKDSVTLQTTLLQSPVREGRETKSLDHTLYITRDVQRCTFK